MAHFPRFIRLPRPKTFLYLMSLRTGTELSTLSLLLNKVSGIYGLLALLTGLHLSPLQLSMYIYSILALILAIVLAPHIRTQSPFHILALACFYVLDSMVNAAYTAAFAVTWVLVISQHHSDEAGAALPGVGGQTVGDTAGFTSPEFNVSHVDVVPINPDEGVVGKRQEAFTAPSGGGLASTAAGPSLGHGVLMPESMISIIVICLLWAVRVCFVLVVMSYARLVLRRHVANMSRNSTQLYTPGKESNLIENPFAMHLPEGKGWKGRLGRLMVGSGKGYWLGSEEGDDVWMNEELAMGKMKKKEGFSGSEAPGVVERERRRRSGTGPPPPPQLQGHHGQHLRVQEVRDGK